MDYSQIRHASPKGLKKHRKERRLTPPAVLLFFLCLMILFLAVGGPMQYYLGTAGLVITELGMLALSLGFTLAAGADLKTVFPVHRPRLTGLFGCVILWIGTTLTITITSVFLMYLFPDAYRIFSQEVSFLTQMPLVLQILVVSMLPAVCEEAVHRGVLQNGIENGLKNIPLLVAVMGALFAVFHLYPIKYPAMILLGGLLSYVMALSGNLAYPAFLHFFNNLVSVLLDAVTGGTLSGLLMQTLRAAAGYQGAAAAQETIQAAQYAGRHDIGLVLIFPGILIPLLLYTGSFLFRRAVAPVQPEFIPKDNPRAPLKRILLPTVLLTAAGILLLIK